MTGLQLAVGESTLAGYLLAVARVGGFVLTSPPFNTRSVPMRARAVVALGVAIPLTTWTAPVAPRLDSAALLLYAILQVVTGAALGFLVLVAVAVLQSIGDMVDLVGGFSLSTAMDPLMFVQSSVMGRLHYLLGVTLLFATDAHLLVLQGLARSAQLMPIPALDPAEVARAVTADVAGLVLATLQVAGPLVAVVLVADATLGLLTRVAPALNAFMLGFPLKILLALLLVGLVITRLPGVLTTAVREAAATMLRLAGAG